MLAGKNPPKRDCVGGWRFPIDAQYSEWTECVNGQQTRTCKTEAAFGGDNTACQKVNGQYPVRSTLATLAARFPALSRRILMANIDVRADRDPGLRVLLKRRRT